MTTEIAKKSYSSVSDDDPTIDELLEAFSGEGELSGTFSMRGFSETMVERHREDRTEDLIAPHELLSDPVPALD